MPHSRRSSKPSARLKRLALEAGRPINLVHRDSVATPERLIHEGIVRACRLLAKKDVLFFHTPNGAQMAPAQWKKFERLGALAGVADLTFILADGRAAFLEVKRPDGGRLSTEQKIFAAAARTLGCSYAVVTSISDALRVLEQWGALKRPQQKTERRQAE